MVRAPRMRAGLEAAKGDFIIALDADGSMGGAEFGRFRDALADGAQYVKGTRLAPVPAQQISQGFDGLAMAESVSN